MHGVHSGEQSSGVSFICLVIILIMKSLRQEGNRNGKQERGVELKIIHNLKVILTFILLHQHLFIYATICQAPLSFMTSFIILYPRDWGDGSPPPGLWETFLHTRPVFQQLFLYQSLKICIHIHKCICTYIYAHMEDTSALPHHTLGHKTQRKIVFV